MLDAIAATVPEEWRLVFQLLTFLIAWIPEAQATIFDFAWLANTGLATFLKRVLLLLPALLVIVAIWCTMLALYTVPFRSGRRDFLVALVLLWWETGRSIWLFWVGIARFLWMLIGWAWGLLKLTLQLGFKSLRLVILTPFALLDWMGRKYFQPGVPWLAFLLTIGWSALEALIFTYALMETVSDVFAEIAGVESRALMAPILWIFLFVLISGSFAALQAVAQAWEKKDVKTFIQMLVVEFFVMFFEVVFLYRELIDAITPWIANTSGYEVGFGGTLAMASFGWIGIRAMTWFLFGRFGTPALLAVLARETIAVHEAAPGERPRAPEPDWWRGPINALKAENEWFRARSRELLELVSLPVLQLLAAAVNCATVVIAARQAFKLPFTSLENVMIKDALVQVLRGQTGHAPTSGD
ncbi:MAG: hypothetical protein JSV86_11160 [Gemmatimonadota bacterium]|nr:MAG: hypothetical protein JSV86_11160 [Gemmatimonadota bacterium]